MQIPIDFQTIMAERFKYLVHSHEIGVQTFCKLFYELKYVTDQFIIKEHNHSLNQELYLFEEHNIWQIFPHRDVRIEEIFDLLCLATFLFLNRLLHLISFLNQVPRIHYDREYQLLSKIIVQLSVSYFELDFSLFLSLNDYEFDSFKVRKDEFLSKLLWGAYDE